MNADSLTTHLAIDSYGDFRLTDAVRPALHLPIVPKAGYRAERHHDADAGFSIPMLTASVSREDLFDVFLALVKPLGGMVDVVLETSHKDRAEVSGDLRRTGIDTPVLMSHFCDFEDLLLNDGCTGVAVLSTRRRMEVQFDEHKLLIVYAMDLKPFGRVLRRFGLKRDPYLSFLPEAEHLHSSGPRHEDAFRSLCYRLGVGDPQKVFSDDL